MLDAFIRVLGITEHIPQSGGFGHVTGESSVSAGIGALMRALAAFVGMVALLSLLLWLVVILTLKLV